MASCSSRKNKNNPSMLFKAERQPCFFKMFPKDAICENKMALPRKFARIYGDCLSSPVILKVPSGATWRVDIVTSGDGRIWLQNGWPRFVKYYSISCGWFLVFQYDKRNSEFNVLIFDKTCSEIHYHSNKKTAESRVPKVEGTRTGVPGEISNKRKEKSPLSSTRPHKKMKMAESFTKITVKGTNAEAKKLENQSSRFPTFEVKLHPSYVHHCRSNLTIPAGFRRKYMKREDGDALLVLNARTWSVKYYTVLVSGVKRTRLTHYGWKDFAQKNHLQVGDVCKFELIDPDKNIFRVAISRSSTGENAGSSKKLSDMKKDVPNRMPKGSTQGIHSSKW